MSDIKSTVSSGLDLSAHKIFYRVDGGATRGMGHIYKGLALEREAKKTFGDSFSFLFLLREEDGGYLKLRENQVAVERIPTDVPPDEEIEWLFQKRDGERRPLLILDILNVTENYLRTCRAAFDKIITMENLGRSALLSDVVINAIVEGPKSRIESRNGTKYFLGGDYKVLNEYFDQIPRKRATRFKIVISLGGGDNQAYSYRVLNALGDISPDVDISLVFGPNVKKSEACKEELPKISPHIQVLWDVSNMAEILSGASLAIIAGGGTLYEIARVGVPGIVICLVPHQERNAQFFEGEGCIVNVGSISSSFETRLAESVHRLIADPALRSEMSCIGRKLIDGKGRKRVVHIIREMLS